MRKLVNWIKKAAKKIGCFLMVVGLVSCFVFAYMGWNAISGDDQDGKPSDGFQAIPTATPWPTPASMSTAVPDAWGRPDGDCLVTLQVASPLYSDQALTNKLVVLVPPGTHYQVEDNLVDVYYVSGINPEGTEVYGYIGSNVATAPECR